MYQFEMETTLPVSTLKLSADLLNMSGVNNELAPLLKMSVLETWYSKPIRERPVNEPIFTSKVSLLGFIRIDLHSFKFDY